MSIRTRLKRLRTEVDWLGENGELRLLEMEWKLLQMKEQISARDPARARRLGFLPEPAKPPQPAPRPLPIPRDAPLRSAPQEEVVRVESFVGGAGRVGPPPTPAQPHPEERPARPRLEGSEPAPPLVQPFTYDPPPEMQIRPVTWRRRGPQDYEDEGEDMYGRCIVDYDPLGYLDNDDD